MNDERRNMKLLALAAMMMLPPALLAWLVNVEMAVRIWAPGFSLLERTLPAGLFALLARLALDLSTITTLTPLLIVVYPLIQAVRILRRLPTDPGAAHKIEADPYPAHFGFFLVMLGLAGTLYGLFIGLHVSGVPALAQTTPTAATIRLALERLLAGTATALLSSLAGLVGAFLAARPVPWLFRKLAGITPAESQRTITETITQLTDDLRALSQASQSFAASLHPLAAEGLFDRLDRHESALREIHALLKEMRQAADQAAQTRQTTNDQIGRLVTLLSQVREQDMAEHRENVARHAAILAMAGEMMQTARDGRAMALQDQNSLRQALKTYLDGAGSF